MKLSIQRVETKASMSSMRPSGLTEICVIFSFFLTEEQAMQYILFWFVSIVEVAQCLSCISAVR